MLLTTTQVTGSNHYFQAYKEPVIWPVLFLFPLLAYLWQVMEKYILSEIFTLIPGELYTAECGETALKEQFSLNGEYLYKEYTCNSPNAVVAYAIGQTYTGQESEAAKELPVKSDTVYPFIVKMLEESSAIGSFNKVIFHYSKEKKLSHIVISAGEELKIANCFKADTFESALYFLFLSIKQLQMNPKQCTVRVCWDIMPEQEATIGKFFKGVEKNNLSELICKI